MLNLIDRSLFDSLLDAGFLLQLVPVLIGISGEYDEVYYENGFAVHLTNDMEIIVLDEERAKKDVQFDYMMTFDVDKKKLHHVDTCECTGNVAAAEENEYFGCAMIVRAPAVREAIEKKKEQHLEEPV